MSLVQQFGTKPVVTHQQDSLQVSGSISSGYQVGAWSHV